MNFVHQARVGLPSKKNDQELPSSVGNAKDQISKTTEDSDFFYRITLGQVSVQDPNIGCGHQIKLVNEWVLRRALFKLHLQHQSC